MLTELVSNCRLTSALLLATTMAGCAAVAPASDEANRLAEARHVLQEARTTATALEDAKLRDLALFVIAVWQADARDVPAALKTAAAIADPSGKADVLAAIAVVQAKAGDVPAALKTAAAIENASQKADVLGAIADVQAKAGDVRAALKTAAAIENASRKADVLGAIAEAQAQAGDVAAALKTAAAIADPSWKAEALRSIAETQAKAGDVAAALKTAAAIAHYYQKAEALRAIAAIQMVSKDAKGAATILDQALNAAAAIPVKDLDNPLMKAVAIAILAADRVDAGDLKGTLAWAKTHGDDTVAKVSALVGAAAAILQPSGRPSSQGGYDRLLPKSLKNF